MARHAAANALARHLSNAFLVLELPPDARRDEIERQGAKLLAMLAAGLPHASSYASPLGPRTRTPDDVRRALGELRDPDTRALHEWWARGFGARA